MRNRVRRFRACRSSVEETSQGAITGVDGRYVITSVPSGLQTKLTVASLGYGEKTVTGVQVPAGAVASLDVTLSPK